MAEEYKGCRAMATLPYAFNDLGYMAGMSRNLVFDDIDLVIDCLNAGNPEVPNYHAIVLAFSEQFDYNLVGKPSSVSDRDLGLVTFSPDLWQIPDVYAFLHAVFNSTADAVPVSSGADRAETESALHKILSRCRAVKKPQRTSIIKAAIELRRAYSPAIINSKWSAVQPTKRRQASAAAHDVPRFFVFVQATAMKYIMLIDGAHIIPLARTTEESPPGVLCDKVTHAIESLRKAAGPHIESCVFGLSTRAP